MDIVTAIADVLQKLGFSFWQVVFLCVLFMLKNEIRQVAQRVSKFKLAGNEIEFEHRESQVTDLIELQAEISSDEIGVDKIQKDIADRIRKRAIGALIDIKSNTSFLWDQGFKKNQDRAEADIRRSTFMRVTHSIDLLEELGHINSSRRKAYTTSSGELVYSVAITLKSAEIRGLVAEASQY